MESGPRLSAAITTPSLNFTARTEVPVTTGCWVCCIGLLPCRYEASYAPYTSSLGCSEVRLLSLDLWAWDCLLGPNHGGGDSW